MIDDDWILRSSIIWRRENAVPEPNVKDRPRRTFENVFVFSKRRWYDFDRQALVCSGEEDVWTIESRSTHGKLHPAVFPPELVTRCLAIGNPKLGPVLDPFMGSGTVLKVAVENGMKADGVDLNPEFCNAAASVLKEVSIS